MCCNCREPINCYDDKTRYKVLIVLYVVDIIFFIIRLSLVSNDISKHTSGTAQFLVPVLLFDLFASVPVIICNIIYVILRHCVAPLTSHNTVGECVRHFATLTCFIRKCHQDRPQAILLMRLMILTSSFLLKFMCFIIAAACSARFKSEGTAYTVFAAFALLATMLCLIVEYVNFFRLWKYNPTDTRNSSNRNEVGIAGAASPIKQLHRCHLAFLHYSMLNNENTVGFRATQCEMEDRCKFTSLHHHLMFHCLTSPCSGNPQIIDGIITQPFIAFYATSKDEALQIAEKGFPWGNDRCVGIYRDYLRLKKSIYFSRVCPKGNDKLRAIICVRLNLGRAKVLTNVDENILKDYFQTGVGKSDTLYAINQDRIYVRMPAQIEKWIISLEENVTVNDKIIRDCYRYFI